MRAPGAYLFRHPQAHRRTSVGSGRFFAPLKMTVWLRPQAALGRRGTVPDPALRSGIGRATFSRPGAIVARVSEPKDAPVTGGLNRPQNLDSRGARGYDRRNMVRDRLLRGLSALSHPAGVHSGVEWAIHIGGHWNGRSVQWRSRLGRVARRGSWQSGWP
jgi:hypothetical protein